MHLIMIGNMDFAEQDKCPIVFKIKNHPKDMNLTDQIIEFVNDKNVIKLIEEAKEFNKVIEIENLAIVKFMPKFQSHLHWLVISINKQNLETKEMVCFIIVYLEKECNIVSHDDNKDLIRVNLLKQGFNFVLVIISIILWKWNF